VQPNGTRRESCRGEELVNTRVAACGSYVHGIHALVGSGWDAPRRAGRAAQFRSGGACAVIPDIPASGGGGSAIVKASKGDS
jgi:hypothetical protein